MTSPPKVSRRHALVLAAGTLFATSLLPGSAALATAGARIPSRGFNLPGWLDRDGGPAPGAATLEKLRQAGFETIRLPVNGDLVSSGGPATLRRIQNGIRD
ncbi:MAG: endoglucanase, partial [Mesorhizobium sp.]